MINLKTGSHFREVTKKEEMLTRRNVLTGLGGIIAAGCAPSIAFGAARIVSRDALAGSANASVGGMMRGVGARNAAMFGGGKPYDYEVEWIKSDGNCWIDTGVELTSNSIHIEASFDSTQDVLDACVLGFEGPGGRCSFRLKSTFMVYNGSGSTYFTGVVPFGTHNISIDSKDLKIVADGSIATLYLSGNNWTFLIFAQNYISRTNIVQKSKSSCSKFYAKLSDDVVRDFVPVVATFNGVKEPCFYNIAYNGDDVHGLQFYRNLGSGNLTAGPRV